MSQKVDLYDTAYGNYQSHLYRQVRIETYGEDLGQTSFTCTVHLEKMSDSLSAPGFAGSA